MTTTKTALVLMIALGVAAIIGCGSADNAAPTSTAPEIAPAPDVPAGAPPEVREARRSIEDYVRAAEKGEASDAQFADTADKLVAALHSQPSVSNAAANITIVPAAKGGSRKPLAVPVHRQPAEDGISCAVYCLRMVGHFLTGHDPAPDAAGMERLRDACGTRLLDLRSLGAGELGFTWPSGLRDGFHEIGYQADVRQVSSMDDVTAAIDSGVPPILLVRCGERQFHYIVAVGYTADHVLIADPAGGPVPRAPGNPAADFDTYPRGRIESGMDFTADYDTGQRFEGLPADLVKALGKRYRNTMIVPTGHYDPLTGFLEGQVERFVRGGVLPLLDGGASHRDAARALRKLANALGGDNPLGKALHLAADCLDLLGRAQEQLANLQQLAQGLLEEILEQIPLVGRMAALAAAVLDGILHGGPGKALAQVNGKGGQGGDKSNNGGRQDGRAQKPASGKDGGSGGDPKPQPLTAEQKEQAKEQAHSVAAAIKGGASGGTPQKLREAAVDETIRQLKISDAQARGAMLRWLGQSGASPANADQAAAEAVQAAHALGFAGGSSLRQNNN